MNDKDKEIREVVEAQINLILDEHATSLDRELAVTIGVACFYEGYKHAVKKVFKMLE